MKQDRCLTRSGFCQSLHSARLNESAEKQASHELTQRSDAEHAYSQITVKKHTVMITEVWQNANE
ncbi:hypothetical protein BDDG_13017 [Blastomyces dermatitidis ATCC 18188]|uniref:Uncharacterized protein n=1 Tax=Ajellomyces dermatitidis (strain ATCC 18188 / CBS 674.68) TaxID=653446 RepID=A0A0J9EU99_AJEDA|nr:hypothetical protein BDDG_13017 [Blastomyces dermatitidis ATCC 18188]